MVMIAIRMIGGYTGNEMEMHPWPWKWLELIADL